MTDRQRLVLVNLIGGLLVLASYALWLGHPSNDAGALWGSIPAFGQSLYTATMLAATAGYFAFETYLLRLNPDRIGATRHGEIVLLHALILFPSALWMPLTYEYLDGPSAGIWWTMRATLFVVGAASATLVGTIVRLPRDSQISGRSAAIAGAAAFTLQTGVLDAFVWPLFFPA